MTSAEIDALVDHIGGSGGFDLDPSMADSVLRSELEVNWDLIPSETRAVMLHTASMLRRLFQPTSITGRAIAEAFEEIAKTLKIKSQGGRPEGSIVPKTEYLLRLLDQMPGAKPAAVADEIFRCVRRGDIESPFSLDDTNDERLIEDSTSRSFDRGDLTVAIYRAKYFRKISQKQLIGDSGVYPQTINRQRGAE